MAEAFSIAEVPSLRADRGSVYVDIGYLAHDDHLNAFVDIFEKFVRDNADLLAPFAEASVTAGETVLGISLAEIRDRPRDVARKLYLSYKPEVHILLTGSFGKKLLIVCFDNPSFEFSAP